MSDFTNNRTNGRSAFPVNATDGQEWSRVEPLLTPDQLKKRFLFGIPLVSFMADPVTRKHEVLTPDDLKDQIIRAVSELEGDLNHSIDIFPVKREEVHAFDRNLLAAWGHFRVEHAPILSLEELSIRTGQPESPTIYKFPVEWCDPAYFSVGKIYWTPLLPASTIGLGGSAINSGGAAVFLQVIMSHVNFMPATYNISYISGMSLDGTVPRIVNELVGCYASINILAMLAASNRVSSKSLGFDGMSQSSASPGPQVYDNRISGLQDKKKVLIKKMKALYGRGMIMGEI